MGVHLRLKCTAKGKRRKDKRRESSGRLPRSCLAHKICRLTFHVCFPGPEAEAKNELVHVLSSCTRAVFLPSLAPCSSEGVSSGTNEGEQFLSGSTALMGFLLGLIPEKSPVGSPPECFLFDLLSLRGIKH